jgi:hypothetical protein
MKPEEFIILLQKKSVQRKDAWGVIIKSILSLRGFDKQLLSKINPVLLQKGLRPVHIKEILESK